VTKYNEKKIFDINLTKRRIEVRGIFYKFVVAYVREFEDDSYHAKFVILPTSIFYLTWVVLMIGIILLICLYLPYQLVLEDANSIVYQ